MAGYVELSATRTWYDEFGSGDPLVLLHPGGVDSRAFEPNRGALAERFATVAAKLDELHATGPDLTPVDLGRVQARTLVLVGDDDEMSGTSHGLLMEKPDLYNRILLDFLTRDAIETFAPIRRRN